MERAIEIEKQLQEGVKLPFKKITYCNIGNPHSLSQKPLTFLRQVLALVEYPDILDKQGVEKFFPSDALSRAKFILKAGGSTGAYSESPGRLHVRKSVAGYINTRDGYEKDDYSYCGPDDIFLTDGASPGVRTCLNLLIRNAQDGVLIPIPQYPLYSASIPLVGGSTVPYFLNESKSWALDIQELKNAINQAKHKGIVPRGLVVINPGNPTGSCLTEKNIEDIIQFCSEENLLLMADEVYQENVYVKEIKPFVSFKKKLRMSKESQDVQLISFNSTSKGVFGECGKRGGYFELTNVDSGVKKEIYKILSINLCPNIVGQITLDIMVAPPLPGDPSYSQYESESIAIYNSLKKRAILIVSRLNSLPGISCQTSEGALYAFPKITLPKEAISFAKSKNLEPDLYYCLRLLDEIGLCAVPGSGFGQKEGEYHFRTTILPQEKELEEVLNAFESFHKKFLNEFEHSSNKKDKSS